MKFEIINPSDKAFIEGDFKTCCLATLVFGEGKYGLRQVDGELEMPLFILFGADEWLKEQFGGTFEELLCQTTKEEIGKALLSVRLEGERSSLNDFTSRANNLGEKLLKKTEKERDIT